MNLSGHAPAAGRPPQPHSLRQRLVMQLLVLAAALAVGLYLAVLYSAQRASQATMDAILGAATLSMASNLRATDQGVRIDLPPSTLSMLSATGQERLFYRFSVNDTALSGYEDLPVLSLSSLALTPVFYNDTYRGADLRLATVSRALMIDDTLTPVQVVVGHTRDGQRRIAAQLAQNAAVFGLLLFLVSIPLSLVSAGNMLRPIRTIADAVGRRGAHDLRPVRQPAPAELLPLVGALNAFIARLKAAFHHTETFLAEAAHHIRTPLATLRSEGELLLRSTQEDAQRQRIRRMIRSADECARSAGQLLEHATILYRSEQLEQTEIDLCSLTAKLVERFRTSADMRDMTFVLTLPDHPCPIRADSVLLEAALRNLLDNAVKYPPAETDIHVSLTVRGAGYRACVRDHGPGIGGAPTAQLVRRFQRGATSENIVGAGLGLTIVQEVADTMGGTFTIIDAEGGGTCATLDLPR
ncbi:MAG: sensor histidine kinase [Rhodobacteraceae bacterium]|nr:sensor histidine kinase [Paracoccaceae bacterium]